MSKPLRTVAPAARDGVNDGASALKVRVLILDDSPSDAQLMVDALARVGIAPEWERVETEADFAARLAPELDLILSDYALPQFDGLQALRLARARGLYVPFILISGRIGEDIAVEAMREGADDYVLKDRMARLGHAALRALEKKRLRAERQRAESALRASEERFRTILETTTDAVILMDTSSVIHYANRGVEAMFGFPCGDLIGKEISILQPGRFRQRHCDGLRRYLNTGVKVLNWRGAEVIGMHRDGSEFPIEIAFSDIMMGGQRLFAGYLRDMTEHKQAREKIARLSRIHAVLSGINSVIVRVRDRDALFKEACRIAVEHGGFGIAWIGTLDPITLDVVPVAYTGFDVREPLANLKSSARIDDPMGQGVVGRAIRERKPIFSNDVLLEPGARSARRNEAIRLGYHSRIAFPLSVNNRVEGVLVLFARERQFFTDDEVKLLTELADDISFALEHIDKEEKIARLSRIQAVMSNINSLIVHARDRQELFNGACRIAVEQGNFGIAWIGTLDPQTLDITPVAWHGLGTKEFLGNTKSTARADVPQGQGAVGRAIREKRVVFVNDIGAETTIGSVRQKEAFDRGYRSVIVLPLTEEGTVVGNFSLFAKEANFFDEAERKLMTELGGDISFALEHIAKERKIVHLSRIHAVMSGISSLIVRVRDRQELFNGACRIAVEAGNFGIAWIETIDPRTLKAITVAWAGLEASELVGKIKSAGRIQGIVARAIGERKPAFSNDIVKEAGVGKRTQEAIRLGYRSRAAFPLLVDDEAVGVIVLFAKEQNFFTQEEMQLLTNLAGDISFALSNIAKEAQLKYLAYYDVLTGLPNRALFLDRITQHTRADSADRTLALVLLDIERFRMVNESLGRRGGDELLRLFAQRLGRFNGKDCLARISADVFGVLVRGVADAAEVAHAVENQILACFKDPFAIDNAELRLAAKAGIALFPDDGGDADTLSRNAEAALKNAKSSGERYLFYAAAMNARAAQALSLEMRLRKAVEAEQFVLHYQPKVEFSTGRIVGLEALIRWNDPETGLVPPVQFIPLLEETGLILEAGRWAIRKALTDHVEWSAIPGLQPPRIAVNVSPVQLRQKDFVEIVRNAIEESETALHALDLEITESVLMQNIAGNIEKLKALRKMDVNIAIDDFGTGYSSLGYLAKLPVNALKIDRSFIITMTDEPDSMTIVSTIISLAHSLNMKVVAEGVETEEQSKYLKLLKCDEMQGYLFSRPLPASQLVDLLRASVPDRALPGTPSASLR
jgi:PAS domain S-box-containing protein/diguanylate cyclase (GGDEF)-like protein